MQAIREGKQRNFGEGLADEADAEGKAVGAHAGGKGDGCEVEEVNEVGVLAEVAVALDGIGGDLFDGVGARGCGEQKEVDLLPDGTGLAAKLFEFVGGVEGIDGRVIGGAGDDLPDGGVHVCGVLLDEVGDGAVALGNPGTFVEETGDGEEWGQVDFNGFAAEFFECVDRGLIERGVVGVAEEFEGGWCGDAEAEGGGSAPGRGSGTGGGSAGVWVVGIEASGCVEDEGGVECGFGEDGDAVEGAAGGHDAVCADDAASGLEADEVVEHGGDAAGAGGVCA